MKVAPVLLVTAAVGALLGGAAPVELASRRPNILIIITDDWGFGDLGIHANPVIRTPHIGRLAAQGSADRPEVVKQVRAGYRRWFG